MNVYFARRANPRRQAGSVAILAALTAAFLVGMAGLALDLGRLYVIKTEAQNAMDACALAAATQLAPGANVATALTKAALYGQAMSNPAVVSVGGAARPAASVNKVNFQGTAVTPANIDIKFSILRGGPYNPSGSGGVTFNTAAYVRCSYSVSNIALYFAPVIGIIGPSTVVAAAAATLSPSTAVSSIPIAVCKGPGSTAATNWGLTNGKWYNATSGPPGNGNYGTGNFGWVDFSPSGATPGCVGNGAAELGCILANPNVVPLATVGQTVGNPGSLGASQIDAWNSRFGVYSGSGYNTTSNPPDWTGYAYTTLNWPLAAGGIGNAYSGPPNAGAPVGVQSYQAARAAHLGFQGRAISGQGIPNGSTVTSTAALGGGISRGRRIAIAPIVDCSVWSGTGNPTIQDFACVLLLNPVCQGGAPACGGGSGMSDAKLEFIGKASLPNSPCAGNGLPGGSSGPLVPTLIQ